MNLFFSNEKKCGLFMIYLKKLGVFVLLHEKTGSSFLFCERGCLFFLLPYLIYRVLVKM